MTISRRRLGALLALVAFAAAAVVGALRYADSSPRFVPVGGSAYGPGPRRLAEVTAGGPRGHRPRAGRVGGLTLAQGVAQLFVVGFAGDTAAAPVFTQLRTRDWGGVLLDGSNVADAAALGPLARQIALTGGRPVPLVVAAPGVPGMPRAGPATAKTARTRALTAAKALRAAGVTMALAPSADIGYAGGPFAGSAFGDNAVTVARDVRAAIDGWRSGGVAPVPGSYPGTGAASGDPASTVATVGLSLDDLRAGDLRVYRAIRRRTPAIQMSNALYAAYDGVTPATLLPDAITALRASRFAGVVVSASLPATTLATGGTVADAAVDALEAGCDLLLVPGDATDQQAAYDAVLRAVRDGRVAPTRYEDAVRRVLALKRAYRVD